MDNIKFFTKYKPFLIYALFFLIVLCLGFIDIFRNQLSIIFSTDGIGQYYPSFLYIGQYIRAFFYNLFSGEFAFPLFDLSIGMGEDVIGTLNYYGFGDPINILAVFSKVIDGAILFSFTYYLRIFLSGITFLVFTHKLHIGPVSSVAGAIGYAFCGFAIYGGSMYVSWLSVMIFFPLMLSGIENILTNHKPCLFIVSVAYGAICGFYYLYMSSLATAVYCVIRLLFYKKGFKGFVSEVLVCFGCYVAGLMVAAPIFLPSVSAMLLSERNTSITEVLLDINNYIPSVKNTFREIVRGIKPFSGYSFLHGISVINILAVVACMLFTNTKKNLQVKGVTLLSIVLLFFPISTFLFNGFGEVNFGEYTNRWVFIFHFVINVTTAFTLSSLLEICSEYRIWKKALLVVCTGLIAMNVILQVFGAFSIKGAELQSYMIPLSEVYKYVDSPVTKSEKIRDDTDLYRVANTQISNINGRPDNVAMINGYYGLNYWFSIVNRNTQDYVDQKCGKQYWRSYGFNDSQLEALAGTKYLVSSVVADKNYEIIESVIFNGTIWNVYLNKDNNGFVYSKDDSLIADNIRYNNKQGIFKCTVLADSDIKVKIALPYNGKWNAKVDGISTKIEKNEMYLSLDVSRGTHEICIEYRNNLFIIGLALMVLGCVLWVLLKKYTKKKNRLI